MTMLYSKIICLIVALFGFTTLLQAAKICFIVNDCLSWEKATFFSASSKFEILKKMLHDKGHDVCIQEIREDLYRADYIIALDFPYNSFIDIIKLSSSKNCYLYLWEPPSYDPGSFCPGLIKYFSKVFTWNDALVDNKRFFKFYYPELRAPMVAYVLPFSEKKLCVLVGSDKTSKHPDELYTARREAIQYFEEFHPSEFDFYGFGWVKGGEYKTYRGVIPGKIADKTTYLSQYRFCICYENMTNIEGYITEKIFDCFYAGCVPIYWGANNIQDDIPSECFIDRRAFSSNDDLYKFIATITEVQHQAYIESIQKFLSSEKSIKFTPTFFCDQFLQILGEDSIFND